MSLTIRQASVAEFAAVRAFYDHLIDALETRPHHPMWSKDGHPADAYLMAALERSELWIAELQGQLVGAMVVNHDANDGYRNVAWRVQADATEVSIVHALGVSPHCQGQGIGSAMMHHVMDCARAAGEKAIRLDLIDLNLPAERVYLSLGFYKCAEVRLFYKEVGWQLFHMYEYAL